MRLGDKETEMKYKVREKVKTWWNSQALNTAVSSHNVFIPLEMTWEMCEFAEKKRNKLSCKQQKKVNSLFLFAEIIPLTENVKNNLFSDYQVAQGSLVA